MTTDESRRTELAGRLAALDRRIERACAAHGRAPGEISVVVVTKTFPARDIAILTSLGVSDIAESRHQEAAAKVAVCADLAVRWHFVGRLQTNKAGPVAQYADVVHSVDRERLVPALDRGAAAAGRRVRCLVQVDVGAQPGGPDRGGADPAAAGDLADAVAAAESLDLRGVMAVAPLGEPAAPAFGRLRRIAEEVRVRHPSADWVSAGMSGDFETAIGFGATHVRIGSALLGKRPPLR